MLTRTLPPSAYKDYIASDAWKRRKQWWRDHRRSPRRRRCRVCHARHYALHHRTYRRLGHERLRDLVPLCHRHHEALHAYQRARLLTVEQATRTFLVIAGLRRAGLYVLGAVVLVAVAVAFL